MTDREKAIVMAYTDVCMLAGDKLPVFYDYVAEIMGSRMDTLQMAMLADEIKRKAEPDFIKLCEDANDKNVGNKWISVKDRLPEPLACVFFYTKYKAIVQGTRGKSRPDWLFMQTGPDLRIDDVTHWMPLPEPPKEE